MTESKDSTPRTTSQPEYEAELLALLQGRTHDELVIIRNVLYDMLPAEPRPDGAPIAPAFVEMLAENAGKVVLSWLEENAPEDVRELAMNADTMRAYAAGARAGDLSDYLAEDIGETVADTINCMAALGHSFVDDYGIGHEARPMPAPAKPRDADLQRVIDGWPSLTPEERAKFYALVIGAVDSDADKRREEFEALYPQLTPEDQAAVTAHLLAAVEDKDGDE